MRTAIVGTGAIAQAHARAATALADRLDLVAAVDVDNARLDAFVLSLYKSACTGESVDRGSIGRTNPSTTV